MLVIPALDLLDGRCVRLTQGRKNEATVYSSNPIDIAQAFAAAGAKMLHVVDLNAAFTEANDLNRQVLRELIRTLNIPIQLGGGLRSTNDVEQVIGLGVSRVVVGTTAVEAMKTLTEMLNLVGAEHIAAGIDARDGMVMTHGWEKQTSISAVDLARDVSAIGLQRVIYTDIRRDGTLAGPNVEQTRSIVSVGLKVTASGGISSLEDLIAVRSCAADSVIVGKALYENRFTLEDAIKTANDSGW